MNKQEIIGQTAEYIKERLTGEGSGHDWWHVYRVWKNAIHIGSSENVDMFVVELAALLHDIADWKVHGGDDEVGPKMAGEWLRSLGVDESTILHIAEIIKEASFKGAGVTDDMRTIEGMVVQDADRLDAVGAIGIARTFTYGGSKGREIYNPDIPAQFHENFEQYKNSVGTTVNHFYEKLFLLKDRMNTETAKRIAEGRHKVMVDYVETFLNEWEGKA